MPKKKKLPEEVLHGETYVKDFFDMVVPSTIKFNGDYYICGDSYRCVWAIKEYPPQTTDQAILSRFGDKEALMLHMYTRFVANNVKSFRTQKRKIKRSFSAIPSNVFSNTFSPLGFQKCQFQQVRNPDFPD